MRWHVATLVMGALSVSQALADPALDHLLACRRTPDPTARLECFDRAADAASTAKPSDVKPTASEPAAVESSIAQISPPVSGRVDFTLANGQVWRQMDAESAKSAKIGDRVVISRTFFSAYWLRIDGGRSWRVTLLR